MPGRFLDEEPIELAESVIECIRPRCRPEDPVQRTRPVHRRSRTDEHTTDYFEIRLGGAQSPGRFPDLVESLGNMSLGDAGKERVLVREVLIERTDRHPGLFGDLIGRRSVISALDENVSSRVENAVHHLPGTPLLRPLSLLGADRRMRVDKHEQYSHIGGMKSITETTVLEAPAGSVWGALQRPETFAHVAGAWLRWPAAERCDRPWQVGDKMTDWVLLFRVLPFSRHTIEVITINDETMTMLTDEGGGAVRTWRHTITVEPIDEGSCHYTDRVDIEAGWLTSAVASFARRFYRYRQRRWQRLAKLLAAGSVA